MNASQRRKRARPSMGRLERTPCVREERTMLEVVHHATTRTHAVLRALRLPAVVLGVSLALGGCTSPTGPAPAGQAAPAVAQRAQQILDAMLRPSDADAAEALLGSLPDPAEERTTRHPNAHQRGTFDTYRTLVFDGAELVVVEPGASATRFPVAFALTAAGVDVERGLHVDMDQAALGRLLGAPDERYDGSWRYQVVDDPTAAPYQLDVTLREGRVVGLRWSAYLD